MGRMGVEEGARGTGGQGGISYLYRAGQGGDPRVMVDVRFRGIANSPVAEGWDLAGIPRHAAHLRRECVHGRGASSVSSQDHAIARFGGQLGSQGG